jgi:hypothetical protein
MIIIINLFVAMQLKTRKHHQTRHSYSIRHVQKVSQRHRSLPHVQVASQSTAVCLEHVPTIKNTDRPSVNVISFKDKSLLNLSSNIIPSKHHNSVSEMNHLPLVLL